jgi:hypothetical protein
MNWKKSNSWSESTTCHFRIGYNKEEFKKNLKDINKQVLETKYTLNLGQLLRMIPDIKCYIFNPIPSKPTLPELTIASIAIDHQMVVI